MNNDLTQHLKSKKRRRIEDVAKTLLAGLCANTWSALDKESEAVKKSIELAQEFIKQIDKLDL